MKTLAEQYRRGTVLPGVVGHRLRKSPTDNDDKQPLLTCDTGQLSGCSSTVTSFQKITEDDFSNLKCYGYKRNLAKTFVTWLGIVCTLGLARLVFHWKPDWMLRCTHEVCPLAEATKVRLVDQYDQIFVEDVHIITPYSVRLSELFNDFEGNLEKVWDEVGDIDTLVQLEPGGGLRYTDRLRLFENKKRKFLWDGDLQKFVRLHGLDHNTPCSYIVKNRQGLTLKEEIVRRVLFGNNLIDVDVQGVMSILFKEVLEPFYMFQVFSVIIWFMDQYYYYAACIIIISVFSLCIGVRQIYKNQRALRNTAIGKDIVSVKRVRAKGETIEQISSEHLAPGDVIIIPRHGCMMHVDAVLVTGSCIVNESLLTGESVPVVKTALVHSGPNDSLYHPKEHSKYTIFSGTKVIQTRYIGNEDVEAVVLRTGFLTAKGELVRSMLFPKPVDFQLGQDVNKFLYVLATFAGLGLIYTIVLKVQRHVAALHIFIRSMDVLTITIPPALPATMTIAGIVCAQRRLAKALIYCISPRSINISGCINCFCFDKTGTLTEDGLDLLEVLPTDKRTAIRDPSALPYDHPLRLSMACCHTLTKIEGQLTGDPLDLKMFEATNFIFEEPNVDDTNKFDMLTPTVVRPAELARDAAEADFITKFGAADGPPPPFEVGIIRELPFSSSLQRMSVITRVLGRKSLTVYTKGAPEIIAGMCLPESIPADFQKELSNYTEKGYRVIALATKVLNANFAKAQRLPREEIECQLTFTGLLVMENRLKPKTTEVIDELKRANIRSVMVTGDNVFTALSVARECHMIERHQDVIILQASVNAEDNDATLSWYYADVPQSIKPITVGNTVRIPVSTTEFHIVVTGKTFSALRRFYPDLLRRVIVCGTVFARMAPEQKQQLIELLQEVGYYVGMCGDGANDCGALKAAHAGISLSETEASVASQFTSKIADISCVPKLIMEGRSALVTSFAVLKYMACYSITQYASVLILYTLYSNLTDKEFLFIDLFLIMPIATLFGNTLPRQVLSKTPPPTSAAGIVPVTSISSQIILGCLLQLLSTLLLHRYSWYKENDKGKTDEDALLCHDNYAVFSVSVFQYITLAVIFSTGYPHRRPMYTNYYLTATLAALAAVSLYLVLWPAEIVQTFFELDLTVVSMDFRLICVGLGMGHFVLAYIIETLFVGRWLTRYITRRNLKRNPPEYIQLQQEVRNNPASWLPPSTQNSSDSLCTDSSALSPQDSSSKQCSLPQEFTKL
ncbi:probable cation-transporting ATPase 13A3 isoform X2 [Varroa jacobsoni]|uniref:probable cation-transporting ATPase 13A3 isoform X2 n=1 Tax=Varroa jacobsoni TaxID=62625 RepID=UPI000BF7A872|nr:probable cation-transporting ATPase 13A3 isoform X2 [Varroa jacobsoni]